MNKNKVVIFYLLMIINHVAHVFEEVWGRFWILNEVGLGIYLAINLVLFCIPVLLFYFVLNEKRWAYKLSIVYAGFMVLQGIGHNVATIITGRYTDGFAGGYTGIGLIIIGSAMIYYLLKGIQTK
ncbi:MAG: hypothetical protein ABSF81_04035 [Bacteroidales bacterium]|jgi:hypothetical protein